MRALALSALVLSPASWAACNVSATTLPFGVYNPASSSATDATGTVTMTCVDLVAISRSWTITMSAGASATYSPRRLSNGVATLDYNIYTTSAHTLIWGDGTAGTGVISGSQVLVVGTNVYTYTMYGRIPPLQDVRAGSYSDAIVVTVNY